MKYAACIEYDGTAYCGWQRLSHAPSVQNEVEKALSFVANHPLDLTCAGRTDSGVHALGQVVHFESDAQRNQKGWLLGCNTQLPDDISMRWIQPISPDFHARFSATSRRYRYIILNRESRPAILNNRVCWIRYALNESRMQEAANYLMGEHDFSSFRASGCQAKHARRNLQAIQINREGDFITIDVEANAFLHHMVRNIVGSLLLVGDGSQSPDWFADLLAIKDRTQAGITASACGLYFVSVDYPAEFDLPTMPEPPLFRL